MADEGMVILTPEPTNFVLWDGDRAMVTFTQDRRVIVEGDIYEAARLFWAAVRQCLPDGWVMEPTIDEKAPSTTAQREH